MSDLLNLTEKQLWHVDDMVEGIIRDLPTKALDELLSGYEDDLNALLDSMRESVVVATNMGYTLESENLGYLDHVYQATHSSLQIQSYNYFKTTVLGEFTQHERNLEWGNLVQLYPWLGLLCQRGSGKSYEFCYAFPLWRLFSYSRPAYNLKDTVDNRNRKETCMITNEKRLGRDHFQKIIEEIRFNDILTEKLNPKNKAGLGVDGIVTETGSKLHLRSYGSFIRGLHVGATIVDDFLDESSMYSKDQRSKFHEIFYAAIKNIVNQHGYLVVSGTPYHERDLYYDLKTDPMFMVFEYPGINPDGSLLAPDLFTYQYLEDKRVAEGSLVFAREVLVSPISDGASLFPYEILRNAYFDTQNLSLSNTIETYPIKFQKVVIGCDFAISGNIGADSTVFTVWGKTTQGTYYLIDVWEKQGATHEEQLNMLQSMDRRFKPNKIICEANNFQIILSDLARQRGLSNIESFTTTGSNKKDLVSGLPSLAALFERGEIKIPYAQGRSKKIADWLCGQFHSMAFNQDRGKLESTSEHDDGVMSTFMAINRLREDNVVYRAYTV